MTNYLNVNIPFFWGFLDTAFLYDAEPSATNQRIPMEFFLYTSIPIKPQLKNNMELANDLGYSGFLSRAGLTEEQVQQLMRELAAPIPNEAVDARFQLVPSPINGLGMVAVHRVVKGEVFPVCRGAVRYNLARYVNHSDAPSAVVNFDAHSNGWMTVLKDLDEGEEVTMDYNDNRAKSLAASAAATAETTPENHNQRDSG